MITTTLGNTDIKISRLGLGGSHLSLPKPIGESALTALIKTMLEYGLNLVDVADSYGWRSVDANVSETELTKTSRRVGTDCGLIVATKGGFIHHEGHWSINGDPNYLFHAIEKSFEAFGASKPVPLWQLHAVDSDYPLSISLRAALRAQEAGLVEHIGICNVTKEQLKEAIDTVAIVSVQNQSSPWFSTPDEEEILQACETRKITFFAHSPLGGPEAWKVIEALPVLNRVAKEYESSVYCVLIAWLIAKAECIVPLVGTRDPLHLSENAASVNLDLNGKDIARLNAIFARVRQQLRSNGP